MIAPQPWLVPDTTALLQSMTGCRCNPKFLLLEHVLSPNPFLGAIMNALNPLVLPMMGANINRRTLDNIRAAGLHIDSAEDMDNARIFKLILASNN